MLQQLTESLHAGRADQLSTPYSWDQTPGKKWAGTYRSKASRNWFIMHQGCAILMLRTCLAHAFPGSPIWRRVSPTKEWIVLVETLRIPDVLLVTPQKHSDKRGFFSESYNRRTFAQYGVDLDSVQDNHSLSLNRGTIRGLHFQTPPFAQDKLVRVVRGTIFDVAVDLRKGSATYGQYVSAILSAENWVQMFVPIGFAHGFCTLTPEAEVLYKVSNYYSPDHDKGLLWKDPAIGIDWPVSESEVHLSDKDRAQPTLDRIPEYFTYDQ